MPNIDLVLTLATKVAEITKIMLLRRRTASHQSQLQALGQDIQNLVDVQKAVATALDIWSNAYDYAIRTGDLSQLFHLSTWNYWQKTQNTVPQYRRDMHAAGAMTYTVKSRDILGVQASETVLKKTAFGGQVQTEKTEAWMWSAESWEFVYPGGTVTSETVTGYRFLKQSEKWLLDGVEMFLKKE